MTFASRCAAILFLVLLSSNARSVEGGVGVSDGGHGVFCRNGPIRTVQLLDSLEAEKITGWKPNFSTLGSLMRMPSNLVRDVLPDLEARAARALGAEHPFISSLRYYLQNDSYAFYRLSYEDTDMWRSPLPRTDDHGEIAIVIPPSCHVVQLGARKMLGLDVKALIDPFYWQLLSQDDKIGLLVHESLHPWFIPESSTRVVRQAFIYLTAPPEFRERNKTAFQELINERREQTFN